MSETKFTPGPLETYDTSTSWVIRGGPDHHRIAEGMRKDDAILFAASPELYEALKKALDQSGCDGDLCAYAWHDEARAAIAKAEGKE